MIDCNLLLRYGYILRFVLKYWVSVCKLFTNLTPRKNNRVNTIKNYALRIFSSFFSWWQVYKILRNSTYRIYTRVIKKIRQPNIFFFESQSKSAPQYLHIAKTAITTHSLSVRLQFSGQNAAFIKTGQLHSGSRRRATLILTFPHMTYNSTACQSRCRKLPPSATLKTWLTPGKQINKHCLKF